MMKKKNFHSNARTARTNTAHHAQQRLRMQSRESVSLNQQSRVSKTATATITARQINSIEYPNTPATTPTEIILIRALDILLEETNMALNESIAEHEQLLIK